MNYIKLLNNFRCIILLLLSLLFSNLYSYSKVPQSFKNFIDKPVFENAFVSFIVKDVNNGNTLYEYQSMQELSPASVMKTVTTATALELLGKNFCFETSILYDGDIVNGILNGNIYIKGSGDPTINSSEQNMPKDSILLLWFNAIKKLGINEINGRIIADESIFDTEGVSMKWMREDIGSDYGQGSYGLNFFDNKYSLFLNTYEPGTTPSISHAEPSISSIKYHNYLTAMPVKADSCYVLGFPFSYERFLYGVLPTNKKNYILVTDIPEPALYLSQYFDQFIELKGIIVSKEPTCYRLLSELGEWKWTDKKKIITTYSPPLREIIKTINFISHNLYADVLIKTIGLQYKSDKQEIISSFEKGARVIKQYWDQKGFDTKSLNISDGSGLAITNKITADFLCNLYLYMATKSNVSNEFVESLPIAGINGNIRNMFKKTPLKGKLRMKSGSMTGIQCFGGYINKNDKKYSFVILTNNINGKNSQAKKAIEELFVSLF